MITTCSARCGSCWRRTPPPEFIYTTSVQNHSPYVMLSDSDRKIVTSDQLSDEELENINAYANGIADTDKALGELLDYIDQREKPTALLFLIPSAPSGRMQTPSYQGRGRRLQQPGQSHHRVRHVHQFC